VDDPWIETPVPSSRFSELLGSAVPLLRDLGPTVDWKATSASQGFFPVADALHNVLKSNRSARLPSGRISLDETS
jgi:hypothetical protein